MEETGFVVLEFDPNRKITPPREAATVVIVRDIIGAGGQGLEVFCVRRHAQSAFMGGALVFPGGKVDAKDQDPRWFDRTTKVDPRSTLFSTDPAHALALAVAACRETLEEGRILPTRPIVKDDVLGELLRDAQTDGFFEALTRREIVLDVGRMAPLARWVTPEAESRRFDARFYLLALPEGQIGKHDEHETTMSMWAKPRDVLDAAAEGRFFLAPPTSRTLELLATERDVHGAFQLASRQTLLPVCPEFVAENPPFIALPGDPAHSIREKRVDGPTRYVLRDGRFVSEDAPEDGKGFASGNGVELKDGQGAV
jgi:8-oxo-dGTP pyrophosphatase MutT (NUDIX family)